MKNTRKIFASIYRQPIGFSVKRNGTCRIFECNNRRHITTKSKLRSGNQFWSYILFVIYLTYVFRIIFPVLDYVIQYKYITEELCIEKDNPDNDCHGSCYLSKEIEREVNPNSDGKTVIIDFIKIPHIMFQVIANFDDNHQNIKYFLVQKNIIEYSSKPQTPPPQISFC